MSAGDIIGFSLVFGVAMVIMAATAEFWLDTRFGWFLERIFNRIARALEWAWFRLIRRRKDWR